LRSFGAVAAVKQDNVGIIGKFAIGKIVVLSIPNHGIVALYDQ